MKKLIIVLILTLITATFSGCLEEDIGPPTVWRNGILEGVKVGDISTITVNFSGKNWSYIFTERLDILDELTTGEYYKFGIYIKSGDNDIHKLVEIYDANETLIWGRSCIFA